MLQKDDSGQGINKTSKQVFVDYVNNYSVQTEENHEKSFTVGDNRPRDSNRITFEYKYTKLRGIKRKEEQ
jgi:hypothetical protein